MRIPSGFEFADLNHPASRRPQEFPDPLPSQLPSSGNPTPSIPASQPLIQDRAQRRSEVLLQPRTTQTQSTANTTTAPPASAAQPSNTVSSTVLRNNLRPLRPLEPRPIQAIQRPIFQATQLTPFHHQAIPIQQLQAREYPANMQPSYPPNTQPDQAGHYDLNQPSVFMGSYPVHQQALNHSQPRVYYPAQQGQHDAGFVTPFLPGRAHNYTAYTCEDSTSSQFR
jgi:hypothetical protein